METNMRVMSHGKVRRSLEDWRMLCARFTTSGLGQKECCQQDNLAVGSFKKWYRPSVLGQTSCPIYGKKLASSASFRGRYSSIT
jgi:hypothetical protein